MKMRKEAGFTAGKAPVFRPLPSLSFEKIGLSLYASREEAAWLAETLSREGKRFGTRVATDADGLVFALIRLFCVNLRPVEAFKTFLDTD